MMTKFKKESVFNALQLDSLRPFDDGTRATHRYTATLGALCNNGYIKQVGFTDQSELP